MTFSQDCVDLAFDSEGCRLVAYDDARPNYVLKPGDLIIGTLTIGRGHTGPEVHIGLTWTQAQADAQCIADLQIHCEQMQALVKVPLTQGQTDALTDFTFNEGSGTLKKASFLQSLNNSDYGSVPFALYHVNADGSQHGYIFSSGKILSGLIKRRQKEIALWNKTA